MEEKNSQENAIEPLQLKLQLFFVIHLGVCADFFIDININGKIGDNLSAD